MCIFGKIHSQLRLYIIIFTFLGIFSFQYKFDKGLRSANHKFQLSSLKLAAFDLNDYANTLFSPADCKSSIQIKYSSYKSFISHNNDINDHLTSSSTSSSILFLVDYGVRTLDDLDGPRSHPYLQDLLTKMKTLGQVWL